MPVAANLTKIRDPSDPDVEFFRSVQQQKDQYQGIWIVAPDGTALAGEHPFDRRDMTAAEINQKFVQETLAMLDEGLKAFGAVRPRTVEREEPLPYRGAGVKPNGSVDLAIYRRKMYGENADGPALRDTLTLTKEEWAALLPEKLAAGAEWAVPEAVARKMVRPLCLNTLGGDMPGPEDARAAHLTAKVESVENGQAQIRLAGTLEAIHRMKGVDSGFSYRGTATVAGLAAYDLDRGAMSSLLLVYQGTYQQGPEPEKAGSVQLGAVIEWQAVNNHVR